MNNSYIAGFFDGEGTISIKHHKKSDTFQVVVTIVNTDLNILEIIKNKFGGDIHVMYRSKNSHKTGYTWRISSRMAFKFLKEINPYSIIKKTRIKIALSFQERIIKKIGLKDMCHLTDKEWATRLELRKKMLTLNKRGITV